MITHSLPSLKITQADNGNLNASYVLNFSSNWNNSDKAGPFNLNANNGTSNTNANISTHLFLFSFKSFY